MNPDPLPLPPDFNPQTNMIAKVTENGVFHESRQGAALAQRLVANGTLQDLALAVKVLEVVLRCQELHTDDPHYGNFYWMMEDTVVFDLNAVEFNLERLIPMMIQHSDRLPENLRQQVLEAIRIGLAEIEHLNVLVVYSNITLLDILNTCLGGELLGEKRIARRGYAKLMEWMQLTAANGTPYEFNSPTYTNVDIRALKLLADLVQDDATRARARAAAARLGLSVALHIHPGTGRWAGPHGRAYQPSIACETPPEVEMLRNWAADGTIPGWVLGAVENRPIQMQVDETAFAPRQMTLTTFHSPSFALGTASRELSGQSNVLMGHYNRPGEAKPGVIYTRYLTNEKWLGDFYHATDRTKNRNLIDEGRFWGVQQGSRAIGLYSPPQNLGVIHSAKAVIIWAGRASVDEIWIGNQKVETLPASIPPGEVAIIGSGSALTAVRPLTHTDLGRRAPVRLREIQGDLVLEIYNYQGEEKPFWEMGWPGAFYQGKPQCGFYLEMAERSAYREGRDFAQVVASGSLTDEAEPAFVYAGEQARRWRAAYQRDGHEVGIEVDLMEWNLLRRWTQAGQLDYPMLECPMAWQDTSGEIQLGEAALLWGDPSRPKPPGWLFAAPAQRCWVAGITSVHPVPVTLVTPEGKVELDGISCGTIAWEAGKVSIEADSSHGEPMINYTTG